MWTRRRNRIQESGAHYHQLLSFPSIILFRACPLPTKCSQFPKMPAWSPHVLLRNYLFPGAGSAGGLGDQTPALPWPKSRHVTLRKGLSLETLPCCLRRLYTSSSPQSCPAPPASHPPHEPIEGLPVHPLSLQLTRTGFPCSQPEP